MASSKYSKRRRIQEAKRDIVSNLPIELTEEIMKRLPLSMVAKTSAVSRNWRLIWLSHSSLIFDKAFWESRRGICGGCKWQEMSNIISNIILHHNGPVYEFHLYIPSDPQGMNLNVSQWLSFLSKIGVRKIILSNFYERVPLPSYIFACENLLELSIDFYELIPAPPNFKGFAYLRSLELLWVKFKHDRKFTSLISSCPRLAELTLKNCTGIKKVKIDELSLENLTIHGAFRSLSFNKVRRLRRISLCLDKTENIQCTTTFDAINRLASLRELHYLESNGQMCKLLGAGSTTDTAPRTLTFRHLQELCLTELDLGDFDVYCSASRMLQSCRFIKNLKISVSESSSSTVEHSSILESDDNYELGHLIKVEIEGIKGSSAELKLIEYVLSISVVLQDMLLRFDKLETEIKVSRHLLRLPRASTKAKLLCVEEIEDL